MALIHAGALRGMVIGLLLAVILGGVALPWRRRLVERGEPWYDFQSRFGLALPTFIGLAAGGALIALISLTVFLVSLFRS